MTAKGPTPMFSPRGSITIAGNNDIQQINFVLKHMPNQKLYISYRCLNNENQPFFKYDMKQVFATYQRNLALEKNQTYEYYYSIENNGQQIDEDGKRQFHYDGDTPFEIDEWNKRWINYQIEALNETLFNKVSIEVVGDDKQLKMKKYEPKAIPTQESQIPGRRLSTSVRKFYYNVQEGVPLNQQNIIRRFSFVNNQSPYLCQEMNILDNRPIKMNVVYVNFESKNLDFETLQPPLKDFIYQSLKIEKPLAEAPKPVVPVLTQSELKSQPMTKFLPSPNLSPLIMDLQNKLQKYQDELSKKSYELDEQKIKLKEMNEYKQSKELLEQQIKEKDFQLQSERNKVQQQMDKYKEKSLEYDQVAKKYNEMILQKESELQTIKNDNKLYLEKYEQMNRECQTAINKNAQIIQQLQKQYEKFKKSKEIELQNLKEKAHNEMDQFSSKLDQAYSQIKQLQMTIQKQGISDNQIHSLCEDICSTLPEQQRQDLNETLIIYQDKIEKLKKIQSDSKELLQCQDEKLLEMAQEKKRICEDFEETAKCLQKKVDELRDVEELSDAEQQLIKQLRNQLAQQTKELQILKQNYEILVKQLKEQILINQQIKEKSAKDLAKFNEQEKQIQYELEQQEQNFLQSKQQMEQQSKEQNAKLEKQKLDIEQQQEKLWKQAEQDLVEQQKNILEKEFAIADLKSQLDDYIEQQKELNRKYQYELDQQKYLLMKEAQQQRVKFEAQILNLKTIFDVLQEETLIEKKQYKAQQQLQELYQYNIQQYENMLKSKEIELKLYLEHKQNQLDEYKTKQQITTMYLRSMQNQALKQKICEKQIKQGFEDIFQYFPQKEQQDIQKILDLYQRKIQLLNSQIEKQNENPQRQGQLQQEESDEIRAHKEAQEKDIHYQDLIESVESLIVKINELKQSCNDANQEIASYQLKIKKLKNDLTLQSKDLNILKQNNLLLIKQLQEEIILNEQFKQKSVHNKKLFDQKMIEQSRLYQDRKQLQEEHSLIKQVQQDADLIFNNKINLEKEEQIFALQQKVRKLQNELDYLQQSNPDIEKAFLDNQQFFQTDEIKNFGQDVQIKFQDYVEAFTSQQEREDFVCDEKIQNNFDEETVTVDQ